MNLKHPVPLWVAACIIVVIAATAYLQARTLLLPPNGTPAREPVWPQRAPSTSMQSTPQMLAHASDLAQPVPETTTVSPSLFSDCPVFDSLQDAARQPIAVCYLVPGDLGLTEVPPVLREMTHLESLNLQDNQISHLPDWIGTLTSLWNLKVNNNDLVDLPSEIGNLTNLTNFDVSNNQLTALPKAIAGLPNLQGLNLSANRISQLPPLGQLKNLEDLSVGGNQLTALPEDISTLNRLKWLYFGGNHIVHIPDLRRLPLESLNMAENPVCGSNGRIDGADLDKLPSSATSLAAMACIPVLNGI